MKNSSKTSLLIFSFFLPVILCLSASSFAEDETFHPNPQLVGWGNLVLPGLGETLRGNALGGVEQFAYETSTFAGGYALSKKKGFSSLDGISDSFKPYNYSSNARNSQLSINDKLTSDILLEFSIKAHMVNSFIAYRDAYKDRGITEGLDQHTALEGMTLPFDTHYIAEPDVWIPLALVAAALVVDYATSNPAPMQPLTPSSNLLYGFNYGLWQPLGSGYPEEAFFRGFLQHEVTTAPTSPLLGVMAESVAFAFSHEPGNGRYSAGAVGAYLGYLSYSHHGDLGPGTTLHFWGDLLLGLETVFLSNRAQHSTAQGGFSFQFNY